MKSAEPFPKSVPVTELKAHLTEYLRAIENGESSIQITRHGKVVAKITREEDLKAKSVANWIGSGRGTATFSPEYDPEAPAFDENDWEMLKN